MNRYKETKECQNCFNLFIGDKECCSQKCYTDYNDFKRRKKRMKIIPQHICIQMDGNRRYAKKFNKNPLWGHTKGGENLEKIIKHCRKLGIKYLTFFALSIENLKRSREELRHHFNLHKKYIKKLIVKNDNFVKRGIRFRVLGNKKLLPKDEQKLIRKAENKTKGCDKYFLNFCIAYSGREEIIQAIKKIIKSKIPSKKINEKLVKTFLYTNGIPEPEMMIKTGMNPEKRLSGFLLWDVAYTELFFSSTLWAEFTPRELDEMIIEFNMRERRFGK